jgi:hypothetical protein
MRQDDTNYYAFQRLVGNVLLTWSGVSIVLGILAQASKNQVVRQAGLQSIVWGAIDGMIALLGRWDAARKQAAQADITQQARRFRIIVVINALLDIGYVAGGIVLIRGARGRAERAGAGVGVVLQGSFLLFFDTALSFLSEHWTRQHHGEIHHG